MGASEPYSAGSQICPDVTTREAKRTITSKVSCQSAQQHHMNFVTDTFAEFLPRLSTDREH
jgi:hypothetical protein